MKNTPRTETYVLSRLPQIVSAEWAGQLEHEFNVANQRIKRLEESKDALENDNYTSDNLEGIEMSIEKRILEVADRSYWYDSRELRAIAFQVRKLEDRIKQLEEANDAMKADLLLWREQDVKL